MSALNSANVLTLISRESDMIFRLSCSSTSGLFALAKRYVDHLEEVDPFSWPSVCATLGQRPFEQYNLSLSADSASAARELLAMRIRGEATDAVHIGETFTHGRGIVFVYSGQGGQWQGMGRELFEREAVFRCSIDEVDRIVREESGFSVVQALCGKGVAAELASIDVIQPTIFAVQVALTNLLRSWGVTPGAVIGHSSGEIAAAYCAGGLTLSEATRIICRRSRLMRTIAGRGLMLFAGIPAEQAVRLTSSFDELSLAATNGPSASVLSGPVTQIQQLYDQLKTDANIFSRLVKVDVASHSGQVETIREKLLSDLSDLAPKSNWKAEFYSTVTGRHESAADLRAEHWWRNLRQTVLFYPVVKQLLAQGYQAFVEVGPHPILAGNVSESALSHPHEVLVLAAQERNCDSRRWLANVAAQLVARGAACFPTQQVPAAPTLALPGAEDTETRALATEFEQHDAPQEAEQIAVKGGVTSESALSWLSHVVNRLIGQSATAKPSAPLLSLGVDSLKATLLTKQVNSKFGITLPVSKVVGSTLGGLVESILVRLNGQQTADDAPDIPLDELVTWPDPATSTSQPLDLTPLQQAYWLGQNSAGPTSGPAHLFFEREARGLDLSRFQRALQSLIARHAMLRSYVTADGHWQTSDHVPQYTIPLRCLKSLRQDAKEQALARERESMLFRSPDSSVCPCLDVRVFELANDHYHVLIASNLLIIDYTSWRIIEREWRLFYEDPERQLPALKLDFATYSQAAASLKTTPPFQRSQQYWDERLATLPGGPVLPAARESATEPLWRTRNVSIAPDTWNALQEKARQLGVTSAMLLCGIYAEVVSHWSHNDHFTLNLLSQNRLPIHSEVQGLVGRFSSTLLLEVDMRATEPFNQRLTRLQEQFFRDYDHRFTCGVEVSRRYNQLHQTNGVASFPVVYASVLGTNGSGAVPLAWLGALVERALKTPQVKLDNQVYEEAGGVVSSWDFIENAFPPGMIDEMISAYEGLLEMLAAKEEPWLAPRPLSDYMSQRSSSRRESMVVPTRAARADQDAPVYLHEAFLKQAALNPERTAIVTPALTMSYGELNARSDALAQRLMDLHVKPNTLIGVVMTKGWEQVVAVLAILKAGAAYLPIDLSLVPPARVKELLELGEVQVILTRRHHAELDGVAQIPVGVSDEHRKGIASPFTRARHCTPDDLAYVIFTSGSTGVPKGVMIEHRAAMITINDVNRRFKVTERDCVIALASLGFDLSVWDLFGVLGAGGTLAIPLAESRMSPERWHELVRDAGVTIWNSVPKVMEMFVEHLSALGMRIPASLRLVMMSGDWIPIGLPDAIRHAAFGRDIEVISLGGATEVSIWSIFYPIGDVDPNWLSIPYGWSLSNQSVLVLDSHLQPRQPWVQGEIYIAGQGLARGYWRRDDLTNAAFIRSPVDGQRLYRTGDLGRYLPDGSIEFLGRKDAQVKIRGYRIELGEIEARVQQHPKVKQTVVMLRTPSEDSGPVDARRSEGQVVAYVVLNLGEQLSSDELKAYLGDRVPFYMVPSSLVFVGEIPLSSNGKVDRNKLIADAPAEATRKEQARVGPRDGIETRVAAVWSTVLGAREWDITARFFEVGGDSIHLIRMASAIEREFAVPFAVDSLFGAGLSSITIEACANRLRAAVEVPRIPRKGTALVPFRTEGDPVPFFAVHPVGGSALCYGRLASLVGSRQRFYALQSIVRDQDRDFDSIPDLAAAYIEEVREVHPEGPYMLGGWSLGGTIAFEMARQLDQSGADVELLVLIDSWAPLGPPGRVRDQDFLEWFCRDLCGIARKSVSGLVAGLHETPGSFTRALELIREHEVVAPDVSNGALREMFNRYCRAAQAGATYVAGPYPGSALLVRAAAGPGADFSVHPALRNPKLDDPSHGWSSFIDGNLRVCDAPGDHYGVVGPAGLEVTARLLSEAIARSTALAGSSTRNVRAVG